MSRFVKLQCGEETRTLLAKHPNAFLLLTQIALRARWKDCAADGMRAGQALIGDHENCGLTQSGYRTAKKLLTARGFVAFQSTNKGTIATLADSTIYSVLGEEIDKRSDKQVTSYRQASDNQVTTIQTERQKDRETDTPPEASPQRREGGPAPEFGSRMRNLETLKTRINALRPEWSKPVRWNNSEDHHLIEGTAAQMEELEEVDWKMLQAFMSARLEPAAGYWRPNNRSKFAESFADVFASAQRWAGKAGNTRKPKQEITGAWK